jgi:hypothetical protein
MTKTVVIHQPDFLPYLGFFHRLLRGDLLVYLDTVRPSNWTTRDKIKLPDGGRWVNLRVEDAPHGTPIRDLRLSPDSNWRQRNLELFRDSYAHAPHFSEIWPSVEALYSHSGEQLLAFNVQSIQLLLSLFGIEIETAYASDLQPQGSKNELLVDILKKVGATHYLSGPGAKAYFDPEPYAAAGITVEWQEFHHPVYPQQFAGFIPFLSSIDLLFNCGISRSREILRSMD